MTPVATDSRTRLGRRIRERLNTQCDASAILANGDQRASSVVRELALGFLAEERRVLPTRERDAIVDQVVNATLGFGPLQPFLDDRTVSEIMVNGPHAIFVERAGRIESVDTAFDDDEHVLQVIDRILAPIARRLDALTPMVDARLPDGSRVNAIIPPLALEGPTLTIRRFLDVARTLDDLVELGTCDEPTLHQLEQLVRDRDNVLVAGPTSSGKTTLLAAALERCAATDRIIVIEDSAELPLRHPHRVRLEARPATFEAHGEVRVRDLVRNALRMRPDRLIVGEVRGAEAFDLVQALNTGHRGCWSTVHANGAEDALYRLESMAMYADVGVPQHVVRTQIARAHDAIVFVTRNEHGERRIASIGRVHEHDGSWLVQ
jgi:pilus assembly protein CpaF